MAYQDPERAPSPVRIEKAISDQQKLSRGARFTLTINASGTHTLHENESYAASVLAVFAPAEIDGLHIEAGLILEIGIGKGAPYSHTFKKDASGKCLSVDRRKIREATENEQGIIWDIFSKLMIRLTDEQVHKRKRQKPWFQHTDNGELYCFTKGKRFLVSMDDEWVRNLILELEFLHRWKKYLRKRSRAIWFWLTKYQHTYYSKRQVKRYSGLAKTAEILSGIQFRHEYLRWRFIETLLDKRAAIVRNTMIHFGVPLEETPYVIPKPAPKLDGHHLIIHRLDEDRRALIFECAPDEASQTNLSPDEYSDGSDSIELDGESCELATPDDDIPL